MTSEGSKRRDFLSLVFITWIIIFIIIIITITNSLQANKF